MRQVFRHYRQISIINPRNSTKPQISGREEIWCDGHRQIRYWNDPDYLMLSSRENYPLFDFLNSPWIGFDSVFIDEPWDGLESDDQRRSYRYINPDEVIIDPDSKPSKKSSGNQVIVKFRQGLGKGIQKVKKMAQKLPSVLKSAWQELNRTD